MSISTGRGQHKKELRRLILDTAERLFAEAGSYDAVSMRKIAREINYSATTIYLYFKDKDDLFQTLLRETFGHLSRAVTLAVTNRDPVVGLYQVMNACVTYGLQHPQHYRLLFMVRPALASGEGSQGGIGEETFNLIRHQVGLCISSGRVRASDQDMLARGAWAVVHGLTSASLDLDEAEREELVEYVLKSYLSGLVAGQDAFMPDRSEKPG